MKRIAIQGTLGSFHDIAAHRYFEGEDIELICCATFEDVFKSIRQDSQVIGMLAIENTIAGSLLHNNELLRQSGTQIIGEHKLRISHSFVCLPEEDWNDITEVNSHPIALMQCRDFLSQHPNIKVVEGEDTARSAEIIQKEHLKGHAAICSKAAAELYGMKVLQEGIAAVNTVGTGDSLVAGFLMNYLRSKDPVDSFRFGASCGSATAYSRTLATREKIDSFYEEKEVTEIPEAA